jgi:hypothetical protein
MIEAAPPGAHDEHWAPAAVAVTGAFSSAGRRLRENGRWPAQ